MIINVNFVGLICLVILIHKGYINRLFWCARGYQVQPTKSSSSSWAPCAHTHPLILWGFYTMHLSSQNLLTGADTLFFLQKFSYRPYIQTCCICLNILHVVFSVFIWHLFAFSNLCLLKLPVQRMHNQLHLIGKATLVAFVWFSPLWVFKCLLKSLAQEEAKSHWLHFLTFLHCAFLNVSSNRLPKKRQSYIGCICLAFLHCAFSNVS